MTSVHTIKIYQLVIVFISILQLVNLKQEMLDTIWKAMQSGRHLDSDSLAQGFACLLFACPPPSIVFDFLEGMDISSISTSLLSSSVLGTLWVLNECLWNESFILSSNLACSFQMRIVYDKDSPLEHWDLIWGFSPLGFDFGLPCSSLHCL